MVETTTPSPALTVTPPELPEEAKKGDVDGAAAFVRHYVALINHAYRTGDVSAMSRVADGGCEACRGMEEIVEDGYSNGSRIDGAEIRVTDVAVKPGNVGLGLDANAVIEQDGGRVIGADGTTVEKLPSADRTLITFLVRYDSSWSVVEWGTHVAD